MEKQMVKISYQQSTEFVRSDRLFTIVTAQIILFLLQFSWQFLDLENAEFNKRANILKK